MAAHRSLMALGLVLAVGVTSTVRAADDVAAMRKQAVAWFKDVYVDGPSGKIVDPVSDDIAQRLQGGHHVIILVSSEMSRTGKAYYGMTWAGSFFAFEMTDGQATQIGLKPGIVSLRDGPPIDDSRRAQPAARLNNLQIDAVDNLSDDAPISGTVVCKPLLLQQTDSLVLRFTYKQPHGSVMVTKPIHNMPADGVLKFSIDAINKDGSNPVVGPVPAFVDLCVEHGDILDRKLEVVSNTLGVLLNVQSTKDAPAAPAATPIIEGTKWQFGGVSTTIEFLPSGQFLWNGKPSKGFWKQDGDSITINANDFTLFQLTLKGDSMSGTWERLQGPDVGEKVPSSLTRIPN